MLKLSVYCKSIFLILLLSASTAFAGLYPGFSEIRDEKCSILHDNDLNALPLAWRKYRGFIRMCELKKNEASKAKVFLISIWSHDYLDARKKNTWEQFPLPILVDDKFRLCGTLPELYPASYVNSIYVSFGRWKSSMPLEIRVDVADPTVSGDYYYAPLLWDDNEKKYKMKNREPISGKRPR